MLEKDPPVIARDPKPMAGLMEFQQKGLKGVVWKVLIPIQGLRERSFTTQSFVLLSFYRSVSWSVPRERSRGILQSAPSRAMLSPRLSVPFR